jgi:hypothetical protein
MRKGIWSLTLATVLTGSIHLSAWASDDYLVTIHLMDTDLITAVKAIAQQIKAEFVFRANGRALSAHQLSLKLTRSRLSKCLAIFVRRLVQLTARKQTAFM